jgi:hypothetical protein
VFGIPRNLMLRGSNGQWIFLLPAAEIRSPAPVPKQPPWTRPLPGKWLLSQDGQWVFLSTLVEQAPTPPWLGPPELSPPMLLIRNQPSLHGNKGPLIFKTNMVGEQAKLKFTISGVTKDSAGNPLGGCTVDVFLTATDQKLGTSVSDANGNYSVNIGVAGMGQPCYCVAYLAGAPDVAGTTVNTLVAA